jgi:putative endonuclease
MLVWYEPHQMNANTIQREKSLKHWKRVWKIALIEKTNPDWVDLYPTLNH